MLMRRLSQPRSQLLPILASILAVYHSGRVSRLFFWLPVMWLVFVLWAVTQG
jgi:hypothetical protein